MDILERHKNYNVGVQETRDNDKDCKNCTSAKIKRGVSRTTIG